MVDRQGERILKAPHCSKPLQEDFKKKKIPIDVCNSDVAVRCLAFLVAD